MDALTFIDHLIGHLAWPLTLGGLALFVLIRRPGLVQNVVERFHKGKLAGFEFELAEAKASAERAHLPPAPLPSPDTGQDREWESPDSRVSVLLSRLILVAMTDPRQAVIEACEVINKYVGEVAFEIIKDAADQYGKGSPEHQRVLKMPLLEPETEVVLNRLRGAATLAKDSEANISRRQAMDYVVLASRVAGYLQGFLAGHRDTMLKPRIEGCRGTPPPAWLASRTPGAPRPRQRRPTPRHGGSRPARRGKT
jgi:hypothetical protein